MVEVIAEAGSNHNGSVERAFELIKTAVRAGATSIKFQFIFADGLYIPSFLNGDNYEPNDTYEVRVQEELMPTEWARIWDKCHAVELGVAASIFDFRGLELLTNLGAPYVKIASTDAMNHELIGLACEAFSRVIISTGMTSLGELDTTVKFVRANFPGTELNLMHCVSEYPCALQVANTQRIRLLRESFGVPVGYSDHTSGDVAAAMALVEGAEFFEKHFTVDRTLPGFDHSHAMEEAELTRYISMLKDCSESRAVPANSNSAGEEITRVRARRGVYTARALPAGHVLSRDDLLHVRPSTGFEGFDLSEFIGARLEVPLRQYEAIALRTSATGSESSWKAARDYWNSELREKGMPVRHDDE